MKSWPTWRNRAIPRISKLRTDSWISKLRTDSWISKLRTDRWRNKLRTDSWKQTSCRNHLGSSSAVAHAVLDKFSAQLGKDGRAAFKGPMATLKAVRKTVYFVKGGAKDHAKGDAPTKPRDSESQRDADKTEDCGMIFCDSGDEPTVHFACGHKFCSPCVFRLLDLASGAYGILGSGAKCPLCRQSHHLDEEAIRNVWMRTKGRP